MIDINPFDAWISIMKMYIYDVLIYVVRVCSHFN